MSSRDSCLAFFVYHFTRKNQFFRCYSKGMHQIPNGNFHGMCVFHFHGFHKPKGLDLVAKRKCNARFPFGNSVWKFWTTFQEMPFSPEIFRLGSPNWSFHLHSNRNNSRIWGGGLNGKQLWLPSVSWGVGDWHVSIFLRMCMAANRWQVSWGMVIQQHIASLNQ